MSLEQLPQRKISTKELQAELRRRGIQSSRTTIEKWIRLGMPNHQTSGVNGKRTFDLEAVLFWIDVRCTSPAPGQVA